MQHEAPMAGRSRQPPGGLEPRLLTREALTGEIDEGADPGRQKAASDVDEPDGADLDDPAIEHRHQPHRQHFGVGDLFLHRLADQVLFV